MTLIYVLAVVFALVGCGWLCYSAGYDKGALDTSNLIRSRLEFVRQCEQRERERYGR